MENRVVIVWRETREVPFLGTLTVNDVPWTAAGALAAGLAEESVKSPFNLLQAGVAQQIARAVRASRPVVVMSLQKPAVGGPVPVLRCVARELPPSSA